MKNKFHIAVRLLVTILALQVLNLSIEVSKTELEALNREPRKYVKCLLKEGTAEFADVGVHLKGAPLYSSALHFFGGVLHFLLGYTAFSAIESFVAPGRNRVFTRSARIWLQS